MTDKIALEKETDDLQILSGMELVIGKKDGTIDNAAIPVRWCLTKPLLDLINASSYNMPQIVIQVNYESERADDGRWYHCREERHIFSDRADMYRLLKGTSTCPWWPETKVAVCDKVIQPVKSVGGGFEEEFDWDYILFDSLTIDELWQLYGLKVINEVTG